MVGKYGALATWASNLNNRARKKPGMTISPRPNNDISSLPVSGSGVNERGKRILIGPSRDLATVTITSVPKLFYCIIVEKRGDNVYDVSVKRDNINIRI